eukprot:66277-Chlamydomonas_euryale.AAC.1
MERRVWLLWECRRWRAETERPILGRRWRRDGHERWQRERWCERRRERRVERWRVVVLGELMLAGRRPRRRHAAVPLPLQQVVRRVLLCALRCRRVRSVGGQVPPQQLLLFQRQRRALRRPRAR